MCYEVASNPGSVGDSPSLETPQLVMKVHVRAMDSYSVF